MHYTSRSSQRRRLPRFTFGRFVFTVALFSLLAFGVIVHSLSSWALTNTPALSSPPPLDIVTTSQSTESTPLSTTELALDFSPELLPPQSSSLPSSSSLQVDARPVDDPQPEPSRAVIARSSINRTLKERDDGASDRTATAESEAPNLMKKLQPLSDVHRLFHSLQDRVRSAEQSQQQAEHIKRQTFRPVDDLVDRVWAAFGLSLNDYQSVVRRGIDEAACLSTGVCSLNDVLQWRPFSDLLRSGDGDGDGDEQRAAPALRKKRAREQAMWPAVETHVKQLLGGARSDNASKPVAAVLEIGGPVNSAFIGAQLLRGYNDAAYVSVSASNLRQLHLSQVVRGDQAILFDASPLFAEQMDALLRAPLYFDVVVLSDVEHLASVLLHHELESFIGQAALLGRVLLVDAPAGDHASTPDTGLYMTYWRDYEQLGHAALAAVSAKGSAADLNKLSAYGDTANKPKPVLRIEAKPTKRRLVRYHALNDDVAALSVFAMQQGFPPMLCTEQPPAKPPEQDAKALPSAVPPPSSIAVPPASPTKKTTAEPTPPSLPLTTPLLADYELDACSPTFFVLRSPSDPRVQIPIRQGRLPLSALLSLTRLTPRSQSRFLRMLNQLPPADSFSDVCLAEQPSLSSFDLVGTCLLQNRILCAGVVNATPWLTEADKSFDKSFASVDKSFASVDKSFASVDKSFASVPPVDKSVPPVDKSVPPIVKSVPPIVKSVPPVDKSVPPIDKSFESDRSIPVVDKPMDQAYNSLPDRAIEPVGSEEKAVGGLKQLPIKRIEEGGSKDDLFKQLQAIKDSGGDAEKQQFYERLASNQQADGSNAEPAAVADKDAALQKMFGDEAPSTGKKLLAMADWSVQKPASEQPLLVKPLFSSEPVSSSPSPTPSLPSSAPPAPRASSRQATVCRDTTAELNAEFGQLWSLLQDRIEAVMDSSGGTILVHSSRTGLLSTKLARRYPQAAVVSVEQSAEGLVAHSKQLRYVPLTNNLLCHGTIVHDVALAAQLTALPDLFSVQVIDDDFIELLLALPQRTLEAHMGNVIALAEHSFFRCPSVAALRQSFDMLYARMPPTTQLPFASAIFGRRSSDAEVWQRIFEAFAPAAAGRVTVRYVDRAGVGGGLVHVHVEQLTRQLVHATAEHYALRLDVGRVEITRRSQAEPVLVRARPAAAVSLRFLTQTGLLPPLRQALFLRYIDANDLLGYSSWELTVDAQLRLAAGNALGERAQAGGAPQYDREEEGRAQLELVERLAEQIGSSGGGDDFSLLDYSSGQGWLSTVLAARYPNATIVSLEDNEADVRAHRRRLKVLGVGNNAVCKQSVDGALIGALASSPEFFRYQFVGSAPGVFVRGGEPVVQNFGQLLTNGISTFVAVPSATTMAAGVRLFFANAAEAEAEAGQAALLQQHLADWERQLVARLARREGLNAVAARQIASLASQRLTLLRVDLVNMTRLVNHHFYSERDGHQRKYLLNYQNDTAYLLRKEDLSYIAYDSFGISLISLLRLGLSEDDRDQLYGQFLRIPLHEDMATWNIQYRAGRLLYLDKDSMETTLDNVAPYAYQIILSFMNYKRTLEDFGQCRSSANVLYGVPHIGSCAGSSKFQGPCKDPAFPVPCADGQCKPNFLQCLRDLRHIEEQRQVAALNDPSPSKPAPSTSHVLWSS